MDKFPQEYELIGFFEVEPTLLDADIPAIYNRATYRTTRGNDEVICHIELANRCIDLQWLRDGHTVVSLSLRRVAGLELAQTGTEEHLVASFLDDSVQEFALWLRPRVRIEWGTHE